MKKTLFLRGRVDYPDEGLTLETSAKHYIPQAKNIPYQHLLIKPIFLFLSLRFPYMGIPDNVIVETGFKECPCRRFFRTTSLKRGFRPQIPRWLMTFPRTLHCPCDRCTGINIILWFANSKTELNFAHIWKLRIFAGSTVLNILSRKIF